MADSKKYNGSTWEHSLRKLTTATEAVENPLYSDGTAITSYTISGNTVQNGTPTPSNPVDVNGVGVRTENLFDIDNTIENYYLRNGVPTEYNIGRYVLSDYIPIESDTATISAKTTALTDSGSHWAIYDENKTFIRGGLAFTAKSVPTTKVVDTSGAAFIRVDYALECLTDCMLNLDSTALLYEPYGYKIPISSNSTTTPVYLGEVESTRKIKRYEITGLEGWITRSGTPKNVFFCERQDVNFINNAAICSHYPNQDSGSFDDLQDKHFIIKIASSGDKTYFGIRDSSYPPTNEGANQLKTYLQQQYAAGTPVTVWYVLASPETAAVNEPLQKIGDYADTLSNATAIPTTEGANSITVDTTVQPSEFTATWTEWHDSSVKEWDGSQWD